MSIGVLTENDRGETREQACTAPSSSSGLSHDKCPELDET